MKSMAYVGLDVHKDTVRAVVLPRNAEHPVDECTLECTQHALVKYLQRWSRKYDLQCYYEAGPCGYTPYHWLTEAGLECEVIAPSLTPQKPGERVMTDRRAARILAYQGRAQTLTLVLVPTLEQEAVRAAVRYREARMRDLVAAKHRVLKFWRNNGFIYRNGHNWTQRHWRWLRGCEFSIDNQWTAQEYLAEAQYQQDRLAEADRKVRELARQEPYASMVGRLICLRGIDVLSAMVIITETIDFRRFPGASQYMGFWGLGLSEHSTGRYRHQGGITKAGSDRVRRILIEAAWHYQHKPRVGVELRRRQMGQPPEVIAHSWKAQVRLHRQYWKIGRAKDHRTAVVAVARELAGFIWAIMTQVAQD